MKIWSDEHGDFDHEILDPLYKDREEASRVKAETHVSDGEHLELVHFHVVDESNMAISQYLYQNIESCLRNLANTTDERTKQRIIRHILHSLRENCITED